MVVVGRGLERACLAGGFVAEDVGVFDDHGADAAGVPEVDVGSGGVSCGE